MGSNGLFEQARRPSHVNKGSPRSSVGDPTTEAARGPGRACVRKRPFLDSTGEEQALLAPKLETAEDYQPPGPSQHGLANRPLA